MPTLPNLEESRAECSNRLALYEKVENVNLPKSLWKKIIDAYSKVVEGDSVSLIGGNTLMIVTATKKTLSITVADVPKAVAVLPFYRALKLYQAHISAFQKESGIQRKQGLENIFKKIPASNWQETAGEEEVQKLKNYIDSIPDSQDKENFTRFINDSSWSGITKKFDRGDYLSPAVLAAGKWLKVAADRRGELVEALASSPDLEKELTDFYEQKVSDRASGNFKPLIRGENVLYYGAPGTGKSYLVKELANERAKGNVVRTVFHPDVQNSDFVGSLKPVKRGANEISYEFSPGPFAKAIALAAKLPSENVILIIEELNRAPAAAVFGELFLLLDRDEDGKSEFNCDFPSWEFEHWFSTQTGQSVEDMMSIKLQIPSNLSIYATMNSADQGVYPLDTAFRRRWNSRYVELKCENAPDGMLTIGFSDERKNIHWRDFLRSLNTFLVDKLSVDEDRLVGPWFLTAIDLKEQKIPGKLLIYLWDDLLRHANRDQLFSSKIKNYGQLHLTEDQGGIFFSDQFLASLPVSDEPSSTE